MAETKSMFMHSFDTDDFAMKTQIPLKTVRNRFPQIKVHKHNRSTEMLKPKVLTHLITEKPVVSLAIE